MKTDTRTFKPHIAARLLVCYRRQQFERVSTQASFLPAHSRTPGKLCRGFAGTLFAANPIQRRGNKRARTICCSGDYLILESFVSFGKKIETQACGFGRCFDVAGAAAHNALAWFKPRPSKPLAPACIAVGDGSSDPRRHDPPSKAREFSARRLTAKRSASECFANVMLPVTHPGKPIEPQMHSQQNKSATAPKRSNSRVGSAVRTANQRANLFSGETPAHSVPYSR